MTQDDGEGETELKSQSKRSKPQKPGGVTNSKTQ